MRLRSFKAKSKDGFKGNMNQKSLQEDKEEKKALMNSKFKFL